MRIVVPVKQIPQVASLRFDAERGRAVRADVPLVLNAYDRRSLGEALRLRAELGGSVTVLTMGPPLARDALDECLRLGADRAVHLCDDAFAGADTLATARALAAAIRRLGAGLVLCGQRSVDAETGAVGPMLAELLGVPVATAVTRVTPSDDGHLVVECLTDVGTESVRLSLPCVLTAAERLHRPETREPSPSGRGQGEGSRPAQSGEGSPRPTPPGDAGSSTGEADDGPVVRTWTAADLGLAPEDVGARGSRTLVRRIVTLERPRRREIVHDASDWAIERLVAVLARTSPPCPPLPRAGEGGRGERSMASLLETSGVRLAARTLVLPDPLRPWATRRLARLAAPIRGQIDVLGVAMTVDDVARAVERCRPELVVATDSADGRDLMAALAARLGLALVTGVEGIHVRDDGGLTFLRPAWGGGVLAVVEALTVPALATIRPEALARDARLGSGGAGDDEPDADFAAARCTPPLALDVADLVIGVGTGIGGPDGLALVERLASWLGAAVGGTRKVVDAGWLPPQQQIGLSGRQVAPPVYLALGIRGSFNHAVGIRRAGTILAVNPEPRAEIFGECDLGIVADWRVVVEPLIERLAQRQQA